jgi:hypothetical protein
MQFICSEYVCNRSKEEKYLQKNQQFNDKHKKWQFCRNTTTNLLLNII